VAARHVGLIVVALIVVALAGLATRVLSGASGPSTLSGLFPLSEEVVDQIVIRSGDREVRLFKVGGEWRAGTHSAFATRLDDVWGAVDLLESAQTVAESPASHAILGVDSEAGVNVLFHRDGGVLETLIIGRWSEDAQLNYLRRPPGDTVYSLPFELAFIFVPDPDAWRDPVIVSVTPGQVQSVTVSGADGAYTLDRAGPGWTLTDGGGGRPAIGQRVDVVLRLLAPLVADGFATADEAEDLDFGAPDGIIALSVSGGGPDQALAFLRRDGASFYVTVQGSRTVYTVGGLVVEGLLTPADELTF